MEVVKVHGGWAVRFETGTRTEAMTRRAATERMNRVAAHRADCAQAEEKRRAAIAALLQSRGIGEIDYRNLAPGDLFTWRPEVPAKVVTEARHFGNGASLIFWEPGPYDEPAFALTLMTPSYPGYGRIGSHD